ncbi:MAG: hypothetical protein A2Y10_01210 [Planctomycetes bacterium GWF2_41_51]|nr:MAG: hypothetical protein A2Y10_01210 [Planctomycetes bacterium GWF2_41_51]HBG25621.1 hypothetical protein [Phycisphaerales bacterium]
MKLKYINALLIIGMIIFSAIAQLGFAGTGTASFNPMYDTLISSQTNHNTGEDCFWMYIQVGGNSEYSDEQRSILYFDVSSLAGIQNRVITSAKLRLFRAGTYTSVYSGGTINVGVHKILAANAGWVEWDVCWAYKSQSGEEPDWTGSLPWAGSAGLSTPGVDYAAEPLTTFEYNTGSDTGYIDITLPPSVIEEWITQTNAGVLLKCDPVPDLDLGLFKSNEWGADFPTLVVDYVTLEDCDDIWQAGLGMKGDINKDCSVNLKDLDVLSDTWLNCNDPRECGPCPDLPSEGVSMYFASAAPATVTINGDLSEWPVFDYSPTNWCGSKWIKIDKEYYDFPMNYSNAYMCLMYSATDDVIYAAVIVDDSDPVYWNTSSPYDWDAQDNIEVFIQGDYYNRIPTNPLFTWSNAQHVSVGLGNDLATTWAIWPTGVPFGGYPMETGNPGIEAKINRTVISGHDHLIYEMKLIPYDNYGGINGTTTVRTNLQQGSKIGFDITLSVKSSGSFGMICPNAQIGKAENVVRYSQLICE